MQISVTETDSMAIKSCENDSNCVTVCNPSSWELSNGTGQEFGFALCSDYL